MKTALLVACLSTHFLGPFDRPVNAYNVIDNDAADEIEEDDDSSFDFMSSNVRNPLSM